MQKDKCLVILNLPSIEPTQILEELHKIHRSTLQIKESNSIIQNNILISQLFSKQSVNEIIKNINKKQLAENTLVAIHANDLEMKECQFDPLEKQTLKDLLNYQNDVKNEFLLISNDENINLYENHRRDINEVYKENGIFAVNNGFLIAIIKKDVVILKNDKKFSEIKIANVHDAYFSDCNSYLILTYKDIFDYTAIYNIFSNRRVFHGRIEKNKVKFSKNGEYFYLENTNQIFRNENFVCDDALFFKNKLVDEQFNIQETVFGIEIENIEKIYEFNNIFAILTNDKIKNIVFIKNNKILTRKNYNNLEDCRFYNSENRMFIVINKTVGERNVFSIETLNETGESTFNQIENEIVDLQVSDKAFIVSTINNTIIFFEFRRRFNFINKIKKTHKVILSMNKNGKIAVIYDYDKDMIEFYE